MREGVVLDLDSPWVLVGAVVGGMITGATLPFALAWLLCWLAAGTAP